MAPPYVYRSLSVAASGCAVARGVTDEDLAWLGANWLTPPELARLVEEYDRVLTL